MPSINKILLIVQILIIIGSGLIAYKVVESFELRHKQEVADLTFSSIRNEFQRTLKTSEHIMINWGNDLKGVNDPSKYCESGVIKTLDNNPLYITYGVGDLKGNILCSKNNAPSGFNLNDVTPKYQDMLDHKHFEVTGFGFSTTGNESRVGVGYPLFDEDGNVMAGLFLSIRLSELNKYFASLTLPPTSEILIADSEGKILVVYPTNTELLGKQQFSARTLSLLLSGQSGQLIEVDEKGRNMIYTYEQFKDSGGDSSVGFIMYGIERMDNAIVIPDSMTGLQIFLLSVSLLLLTYVILINWKILKTSSRN